MPPWYILVLFVALAAAFVAWLGWLAASARTSAPAAAAYFAERGQAIKAERDQLEKVLG